MKRRSQNKNEMTERDLSKEIINRSSTYQNMEFYDNESFIEFMNNTLDNLNNNEKIFVIKLMDVFKLDNIVDRLSNIKYSLNNYQDVMFPLNQDDTVLTPLYNSMIEYGNCTNNFLRAIVKLLRVKDPGLYTINSKIYHMIATIIDDETRDSFQSYNQQAFIDCVGKLKECIVGIIEPLMIDQYFDEEDDCTLIDRFFISYRGNYTPFETLMTFVMFAKLDSYDMHPYYHISNNELFKDFCIEDIKTNIALIVFSILYSDENMPIVLNIMNSIEYIRDIKQVYIDIVLALHSISITSHWASNLDDSLQVKDVIKHGINARNIVDMVVCAISGKAIKPILDDGGKRTLAYYYRSNIRTDIVRSDIDDLCRIVLLDLLLNPVIPTSNINIQNIKSMDDLLVNYLYRGELTYTMKMILCDVVGAYNVLNYIYGGFNKEQYGGHVYNYREILRILLCKINFKDFEWIYLSTHSKSLTRNAFKIQVQTTKHIAADELIKLANIDDPEILERALVKYN